MSVEELAGVLHRVIDSAGHARQAIADGTETLIEARDLWDAIFTGISGECADLATLGEHCGSDLERLHELLAAVETVLRYYLDQLGVSAPVSGSVTPQKAPLLQAAAERPRPVEAERSKTAESPYGDRYPGEAAWGAHLMDRYSPPGSGVPVAAFVRAKGHEVTHEFKPGQEYWARRATRRAESIEAPAAFWRANITHHVEIEAAAWMIDSSHREAEIIVNRTPCGYRKDLEPQRKAGCHQFLQGFLPQGHTLHVYGTDEDGRRYFIATYEGKNPR